MKKLCGIGGLVYIAYATAIAASAVGEKTCEVPTVVGFEFPFAIFILVAVPFILGWMSANDWK